MAYRICQGLSPWTSTQALNNSTLPFVLKLANEGLDALDSDAALALGLNVKNHRLMHPAVQKCFPDL
jgi:alanine dehydrogenase